jgi:SAM-dependent methyltransferase
MSIYAPLKIFDPKRKYHLVPDRTGWIIEQCRGRTVLHVGCTDSPITQMRLRDKTLLHGQLTSSSGEVIGIDISDEGLAVLQEAGFSNVRKVDAESMRFKNFDKKFEVILAGDVMEHMNNPGNFLESALSVLEEDGKLIIGVPSALTFNILKAWLFRHEQVHKDHCFYYSPKTLSCLCSRYGLLPTRLLFTCQPLTKGESRVFGNMRSLLIRVCPPLSPSMIMVFKRAEFVDQRESTIWK